MVSWPFGGCARGRRTPCLVKSDMMSNPIYMLREGGWVNVARRAGEGRGWGIAGSAAPDPAEGMLRGGPGRARVGSRRRQAVRARSARRRLGGGSEIQEFGLHFFHRMVSETGKTRPTMDPMATDIYLCGI